MQYLWKDKQVCSMNGSGSLLKLPSIELAETCIFLLAQQEIPYKILTFLKACSWHAAGTLHSLTSWYPGSDYLSKLRLFSPVFEVTFIFISHKRAPGWWGHFLVTQSSSVQPTQVFCRIPRKLEAYLCSAHEPQLEQGHTSLACAPKTVYQWHRMWGATTLCMSKAFNWAHQQKDFPRVRTAFSEHNSHVVRWPVD